MNRQRARIVIEVDLDGVPGWGDSPRDFAALVRRHLAEVVPHYNPTVSEGYVLSPEHAR